MTDIDGFIRMFRELPPDEKAALRLLLDDTGTHPDWIDSEFVAECKASVGSEIVSLESVRDALSKIPGNMADVVSEDRGTR